MHGPESHGMGAERQVCRNRLPLPQEALPGEAEVEEPVEFLDVVMGGDRRIWIGRTGSIEKEKSARGPGALRGRPLRDERMRGRIDDKRRLFIASQVRLQDQRNGV